MPSKSTHGSVMRAAVPMATSISIVAISAIVAAAGASIALNAGLTVALGALIGAVVIAAWAGYGRSTARTRVIGFGLVVALIAAIQLVQLWNDGLLMTAPWLAVMLFGLSLIGLAAAAAGQGLEA